MAPERQPCGTPASSLLHHPRLHLNDALVRSGSDAYVAPPTRLPGGSRESFAYFEQLSRSLLGREPAQVLIAYELPNAYIGERGPSWLQRWALTRGVDPGTEPRAPQWVERVAYP